ncbi:BTAD domain-containing putative transcriptional regulator [Streptomyces sp. NPDC086787]|uniref:AfsR/SARP family transcriptional regulator n=1 Tax=Streptomyces sp. NPDC086787 TaxID=3365759 RepID=UPI0037F9D76B
MEIRILGPVRVVTEGRTDNALGGSKQRTVLAALLLAGGKVVPDARLSRLLWEDRPPTTATAQLHTYASRIRRNLDGAVALVRIRSGYQLDAGSVGSDLSRFRQLSGEGHRALRAGDFGGAARDLRAALAQWRGEALADASEQLAATERPQLEERRLEAEEALIEAGLCLGQHRRLVADLTALVAQHPLRERFRAQLMTALYRSDRQSEALTTYVDGRRLLAEHMGVEPGRLLSRTHQAVLSGDAALRHRLAS